MGVVLAAHAALALALRGRSSPAEGQPALVSAGSRWGHAVALGRTRAPSRWRCADARAEGQPALVSAGSRWGHAVALGRTPARSARRGLLRGWASGPRPPNHHPSCANGARYVRDKTRPIVITVAAPTPSCSRTPTAPSRWRCTAVARLRRSSSKGGAPKVEGPGSLKEADYGQAPASFAFHVKPFAVPPHGEGPRATHRPHPSYPSNLGWLPIPRRTPRKPTKRASAASGGRPGKRRLRRRSTLSPLWQRLQMGKRSRRSGSIPSYPAS
jgi:hypothetical protein